MGTPIDSRLLSVIVHDIRTPLNVITLSLRMVEQLLPKENPDLSEDLQVVHANVAQIDEMLALLGDYCRLLDELAPQQARWIDDPNRLVTEEVEFRAEQSGQASEMLRIEGPLRAPGGLRLDEFRARLAIRHALSNAVTSAAGAPVRVVVDGAPDRWRTRIEIQAPPPSTIEAVELQSDRFDRLLGNSASRLGLELTIAALVSEQFGGLARLEVAPGRNSAILLDWPVQVNGASA